MQLTVDYEFLPKRPSSNASIVMDHFGISFETGRHEIAAGLELPIQPNQIVCFTGPSGSGKSSLMRAAAKCLSQSKTVINIDHLDLGDHILVDALGLPADDAIRLLAACGLGEAQLMLRTSAELSDGQRYRFRLALAIAQQPDWILADEFTATLDRTLAQIVAFNIRRLCSRTGIGFLLATTHEDVVADLQPELHLQCELDGQHELTERSAKKKRCSLPRNSGSAKEPNPTGRISLGGITAVITSGSCSG